MACTLQAGVDLAHLHGSFQPHHLQAVIAEVCGIGKTRLVKSRQVACLRVQEGAGLWKNNKEEKEKTTPLHLSRLLPCEIVFRSSWSVMTSQFSTFGTLSAFLDSPQRLEPPCMLGMLRTAMPSICMLLRYKGLPQHWRKKTTTTTKQQEVAETADFFFFFKEAVV